MSETEELKKLRAALKCRDKRIEDLKEYGKYWTEQAQSLEYEVDELKKERQEFRDMLVKFLDLRLAVDFDGDIR